MDFKILKLCDGNRKNDLSRKINFWAGLMICVTLFLINPGNSSTRTPVGFHNFFERLVSINKTKKFTAVDESGETVLHKAVKYFPILNETLDIFKEHGVDFNALDKSGNSAFFYAVEYGRNASFLSTLINYGMEWQMKNKNNDTALHVAAMHENLPAVNFLISLRSDVNAENANGQTALHHVVLSTNVSQNTFDIVSALVHSGANLTFLDEHGDLTLQLVIGMVNTNKTVETLLVEVLQTYNRKFKKILEEFVQLKSNTTRIARILEIVQTEDLNMIKGVLNFVENGTEITEIWDEKLQSLLHIAIKYRDYSVVEYLINRQGFEKKLNDTKFNTNLVELCLENISTVLPATFEQKFKMLQLLFSVQPDLIESRVGIVENWGGGEGITPLLYSIRNAFSQRNGKQFELIQMLINNRANVNAIIPEHNITALMLAALLNPLESSPFPIIRILIENNADANAIDQLGNTFINYVAVGSTATVFQETADYLDSINNTKSFFMKNENEQTVLHLAVYYMRVLNVTLEIFKRRGVDFNAIDDGGDTVLFKAIRGGRSSSFLKTLIEFGADWQLKDDKQNTAVHIAALCGNLDALKLFMQLGADVNALNSNGNPPLHYVFLKNQNVFAGLDIVSELIRHGANSNFQTESRDQLESRLDITVFLNDKNQSLLHVAIERDEYSLAEYLVHSQGFSKKLNDVAFSGDLIILSMSDINTVASATFEQKLRILQLLFRSNPDLIEFWFPIYTWGDVATPLLHSAAMKFSNGKQFELIQMLIQHNANVFASSSRNKRTALHMVSEKNGLATQLLQIIRILIENHADANAVDEDGNTFLHFLARSSSPAVFHETVSFLDSTNNTDSFTIHNIVRETVVHLAVGFMEVNNETLEILEKRGVDFNKTDVDGSSILFRAISGGRVDSFLKTLIQFGADWQQRDGEKNTALHVAALFGNLEALKLFILLGADVNAVNIYGKTPLHCAFIYSWLRVTRLDLVSELINTGANVNIRTKSGNLAIDLARDKLKYDKWSIEDGIIQLLENSQNH